MRFACSPRFTQNIDHKTNAYCHGTTNHSIKATCIDSIQAVENAVSYTHLDVYKIQIKYNKMVGKANVVNMAELDATEQKKK